MIAVITGDVISSTTLDAKRRSLVLNTLKAINLDYFDEESAGISLFRGDSIQVKVMNPEKALEIALYIKACVKSLKIGTNARAPMVDIRLSIGIGEMDFETDEAATSDGSAFRLSGQSLDKLHKSKVSMMLSTVDEAQSKKWEVIMLLLDEVVGNWSISSAEIVKLLIANKGKVDEELDISKAAVSQRKKHAGWKALESLMNYYKTNILL